MEKLNRCVPPNSIVWFIIYSLGSLVFRKGHIGDDTLRQWGFPKSYPIYQGRFLIFMALCRFRSINFISISPALPCFPLHIAIAYKDSWIHCHSPISFSSDSRPKSGPFPIETLTVGRLDISIGCNKLPRTGSSHPLNVGRGGGHLNVHIFTTLSRHNVQFLTEARRT